MSYQRPSEVRDACWPRPRGHTWPLIPHRCLCVRYHVCGCPVITTSGSFASLPAHRRGWRGRMEYPYDYHNTAPFPKLDSYPPQEVPAVVDPDSCSQCAYEEAHPEEVPECCRSLPSVLHIQPTFALQPFPVVNPLSANIMENMNQQMRTMEENMQRMQQHMEQSFRNFNLGGTMSPPPMINSMATLPRMPNMFPKVQDFSHGTLPRGRPNTNQHMIAQRQNSCPVQGSPPSPSQSSTTGSIYVKGPQPNIIACSPQHSPVTGKMMPSPGFITPDPMGSCITEGNDGKKQLKLQFDMHDFKPDEIKVKKDKNRLEVHAHHEEKQPDRISCRVFHQQYDLPKDVRLTKLNSSVTPDGYLTVESPVKPRHRVKFAGEDQKGRLKYQVQENRFPTN